MSTGRKLFLGDLDPSSSIVDLSSVPDSVWELRIETAEKFEKSAPRETHTRTILNVPFNLTLLDVGPTLSSNLTEPFHLPLTLVSYRGPIISGMKLPPHLEKLVLIESTMSLQTSDVVFPPHLSTLVVQNPLKFSKLDSIALPRTLQYFQIVGKYNCSLEKMSFPPTLKQIDVGVLTQPLDLLATQAQIVSSSSEMKSLEDQKTKALKIFRTTSNLTIELSKPESSLTLQYLRLALPRLDDMHVFLDDNTSLGDVWTDLLFEGRVQVRQLTITNQNPQNACMRDCGEVFHRSSYLKRKLCRKLVVVSEKYQHASHLNLASSLRNVGGISLEISYDKRPSECLLPRFASILGLKKKLGEAKYQSDSFGAIPTSVDLSSDGRLNIVVGDSPLKYDPPRQMPPLVVPVSSSALQEASGSSKPRDKPIVLYTWKACGFCQKQKAVIEEFTSLNNDNKNMFFDKVKIVELENPQDVPDKRIESFPTWVKNDTLIVGVQSVEKLKVLLED